MKIVFEPEAHTYTVDGARVPSVSRICDVIDPPSPYWKEEYATRGKYVHSACEYLDRGILKRDTLDPLIDGYLCGWEEFKRGREVEILHIETMVSSSYGFAGRLDRVIRVPQLGTGVLDLKSGDPGKWRGRAQTAGYAQGVKETLGVIVDWRACLQLFPTGDFKVHFYDNPRDLDAFLGALFILNWKEEA